MVHLLIHIRRILLIFGVVFLMYILVRRLLLGSRPDRFERIHPHIRLHPKFHLHWWVYIFTIYIYVFMCNYIHFRRFIALLDSLVS